MGMDEALRILFSQKELDQRILVKSMRHFSKNADVLRVLLPMFQPKAPPRHDPHRRDYFMPPLEQNRQVYIKI